MIGNIATCASVVTATHQAVFKDIRQRSQSLADITNTGRQMADFDIALNSLNNTEACQLLAKEMSHKEIKPQLIADMLEKLSVEQATIVVSQLSAEKISELSEFYTARKKERSSHDFKCVTNIASDAIETYCDIILIADSIGSYIQRYYENMKESRLFLNNEYKFKYAKFSWGLQEQRNDLQEYVMYLDTHRLMPRMTQYLSYYAKDYFGNGTYTFYAQQKWQQKNTVEAPLYENCKDAIRSFGVKDDEVDIWACVLMVRALVETCMHSIMDFNKKVLEFNNDKVDWFNKDFVPRELLHIFNEKNPELASGLKLLLFNPIITNCDKLLGKRLGGQYMKKALPIIKVKFNAYRAAVKDYPTVFGYLAPVIDNVVKDYAYYFFTMAAMDLRNGNGIADDVKNDIRYLHQKMDVYSDLRKDLKKLCQLLPSNNDIIDLTDMTREIMEEQKGKLPMLERTIELLFMLRNDEEIFPYDNEFLKKFHQLGLLKNILI